MFNPDPHPQPHPAASDAPQSRWLWWLARAAFLMFVGAVLALLWFSEKTEREEQQATLISDMLWLEQNLRFLLTHNEELLGRFDPLRLEQADVFDAHARSLIASSSGIIQVLWLDPSGIRIHRLPAPLDAADKGRDALSIPATELTRLAHSLGRAVYGPPYTDVTKQWQFEVHAPVFREGQLAGTAVAVYSVPRLLEESVPWWLAERYRIDIIDQAGQALGQRSKLDSVTLGSMHQIPFDPPGYGLVLRAAPYLKPTPLAGRLISVALVLLAFLVLASLWALRRDVQRRLAAEAALQNEVAFRKAMEDSVQTGLRARTLDGKITYVNPAFCRMVGWTAEDLIGRLPPMPYWAEEHLDETRNMHARVLAGQSPSTGFEIRFRRKNGDAFDALIHESPLIDNLGRHTGWMGSVVDITERKRDAEHKRQQEERLQASSRLVALGEMASSLAHELNQPLAAISSYCTASLNLLRNGSSVDALIPAIEKAVEQAQRAGQIIRRIYDGVRRSDGGMKALQLDACTDAALSLIEHDLRRQSIRIQSIYKARPIIMGDHVMLEQALINLLRNAADAMQTTPSHQRHLVVELDIADGYASLAIIDRGSGIPLALSDKLFDPLFTTKPEGLGMGLAVCRSIIENHRGRLWFESNPDGGTIFHVLLPLGRK